MGNILAELQPKVVWSIFEEICQIPRPSKKEEKIIEYLLEWAKKNNIEAKRDTIGNVLMRKAATKGKENSPSVVLQSHMDMVCEKNNDVNFNFEKDAIIPRIEGEWVKATGTTLGADDGIGMAAQMAVLLSSNISHGPIEALFTVDEETGLTGAFEIQENFFESKILINLDSEDEGELFIGCAGGIDTIATFDFEKETVPANHTALKIEITGLKGGHSGDEIDKGLGNANKIINRFLWNSEEFNLKLSFIDGGNLRNAIARESTAIFTIDKNKISQFQSFFENLTQDIKKELSITEPDLAINLTTSETPNFIIDENTQYNLLNSIYACPHGVISMSQEMKGMVETSTNLASIKMDIEKMQIIITTSQRSDSTSAKKDIKDMLASVFILAGASVEHSDGYPGWKPNTQSEILDIAAKSYKKLFNKKPIVRSIHAGLECGLFLEKYPDLDMISFGPTLRAVHSPDERILIPTVEKFWKHLVDLLETI